MVFRVRHISMEDITPVKIDLAFIAELAHTAVTQYAKQVGEDSHLSWGESPDWVRESALAGVAFHILNPEATAAQTHEHWLAKKQEEGWSCGPVKDSERKTHPCMVPYDELSTAHRIKDHLFKAVVDSIIAGLEDHGRSIAIEHCGCEDAGVAYDASMGTVGMEGFGDALKSFYAWLQKDDNSKKPDDRDLKESQANYFKGKEYGHGQIRDKKLIERLNWGESAISPKDHGFFRVKIAMAWEDFVIDLVEGGINKAVKGCSEIIAQLNAGKNITERDIRKAMCPNLPTLVLPLPGGRAFISGSDRFNIEYVGNNRPVEKGSEADFIALDKSYTDAVADITETSSNFRHWYGFNELWEEHHDIDFSAHQNVLDLEWILDECLKVVQLILNERKTLIKHWVDASTKK